MPWQDDAVCESRCATMLACGYRRGGTPLVSASDSGTASASNGMTATCALRSRRITALSGMAHVRHFKHETPGQRRFALRLDQLWAGHRSKPPADIEWESGAPASIMKTPRSAKHSADSRTGAQQPAAEVCANKRARYTKAAAAACVEPKRPFCCRSAALHATPALSFSSRARRPQVVGYRGTDATKRSRFQSKTIIRLCILRGRHPAKQCGAGEIVWTAACTPSTGQAARVRGSDEAQQRLRAVHGEQDQRFLGRSSRALDTDAPKDTLALIKGKTSSCVDLDIREWNSVHRVSVRVSRRSGSCASAPTG